MLVLEQFRQVNVGREQRADRLAIVLGQLIRLDAPQKVVQLLHVDLDRRRLCPRHGEASVSRWTYHNTDSGNT